MSIVRPSAPQPVRTEPASFRRPATPSAKPPSFTPSTSRKESHHSPARSQANAAQRREANRTTQREPGRDPSSNRQDEDARAAGIPSAPGWRNNDGGDRQHSDEQTGNEACGTVASAREAAFDAASLTNELAPLGSNDGIFEVILPSGATLGVAVSTQASAVRFLLSTSGSGLATQLRRQRMELEGRLERRMGRHVMLTVL